MHESKKISLSYKIWIKDVNLSEIDLSDSKNLFRGKPNK